MKNHILPLISASALLLASCSQTTVKDSSTVSTLPETTDAAATASAEEPAEDITLTLACFINTGLDNEIPDITEEAFRDPFFLAVKDFNDNNEHISIELKNYYEYYDTSLAGDRGSFSEEAAAPALRQLIMDIMKGGIVDILPASSIPDRGGTFDILAAKGAFADLYTFMEKDPEINTSTLNAHVLSLFENEGELPFLITGYSIETLYGEERYVGTGTNWTFDEFVRKWEEMPEGSAIAGHNTRNYIYYTVLRRNITSFIDYRNGVCSFDSPEFIRMLDFIGTFAPAGNEKPDILWEAPCFLWDYTVRGFNSYHEATVTGPYSIGFDGTEHPCTLVGYPSEDGSGSFISPDGSIGICRASSPEKQEAAWQFLRSLVREDRQYEEYFRNDFEWTERDEETDTSYAVYIPEESGFPVNNAAFEKCADTFYGHNENGEPHYVMYPEGMRDIGWPGREEYAEITGLINSVGRCGTSLDNELWALTEEEMLKFCWGEASSEETAAMLQNRASILVSEKS